MRTVRAGRSARHLGRLCRFRDRPSSNTSQSYFRSYGSAGNNKVQKPASKGNPWILSRSLPIDVRLAGLFVCGLGGYFYYQSSLDKKAALERAARNSTVHDDAAYFKIEKPDDSFKSELPSSTAPSAQKSEGDWSAERDVASDAHDEDTEKTSVIKRVSNLLAPGDRDLGGDGVAAGEELVSEINPSTERQGDNEDVKRAEREKDVAVTMSKNESNDGSIPSNTADLTQNALESMDMQSLEDVMRQQHPAINELNELTRAILYDPPITGSNPSAEDLTNEPATSSEPATPNDPAASTGPAVSPEADLSLEKRESPSSLEAKESQPRATEEKKDLPIIVEESLNTLKENVSMSSGDAIAVSVGSKPPTQERVKQVSHDEDVARHPMSDANHSDSVGGSSDGEGMSHHHEEAKGSVGKNEDRNKFLEERISNYVYETKLKDDEIENLKKRCRVMQERATKKLAAAKEEAERRRKAELKSLAETLEIRFSEQLNKERAERLERLDEIRHELNSLSHAFNLRSEDQRVSHTLHTSTIETLALEAALATGKPFANELESMVGLGSEIGFGKGDEVLDCALEALPKSVAKQGVATHSQLMDRWPAVRDTLSQLGYFQGSLPTFVSVTLAKIANAIKFKESPIKNPTQASMEDSRIDHALAVVDRKLVEGDFGGAAEKLEKALNETAGEVVARNFATELRNRVLVQQTITLLKAHTSAKMSGLS